MDVKLPDGTTVSGVPEGITKAELATKLKANGMNVPAEWMPPTATPTPAPVAAPVTPLQRTLQTFGRTFPKLPGQEGFVERIGETAYKRGGQVADVAAKAGLPPPVAAGLGTAANVGIQAVPMLFGGEIGKVAAPLFRSAAERTMQSALKPSPKALKSGDAITAIDTMLDEGISLTKGGVAKLRDKISILNDQIKEAIAPSKATVPISDVYKPLLDKLEQFKRQVNPDADTKAIAAAWNEFKAHPLIGGKSEIPIQLAQELKQGTYSQLNKKYGEMGTASTEAQKALARGLKEGVEKGAPEAVQFTKDESRLIRTLKLAEKRVLMDANKNLIGLSALAHDPVSFGAFMADRSAAFKSLIARVLNAGKEQIPATISRAAIAAPQAINQALRPPGANNEQTPINY